MLLLLVAAETGLRNGLLMLLNTIATPSVAEILLRGEVGAHVPAVLHVVAVMVVLVVLLMMQLVRVHRRRLVLHRRTAETCRALLVTRAPLLLGNRLLLLLITLPVLRPLQRRVCLLHTPRYMSKEAQIIDHNRP